MFSLFKKNEMNPTIHNKVWIGRTHKWKACLQILQENPVTIFVTWFDETFKELDDFLQQHQYFSKVIMYRQALQAQNSCYVFAEHYPISQTENELFEKLHLNNVTILSGLDEPLFKYFGSDKIIEMVKNLGMNEDEMIEHNMINSAIVSAQKKLSKKIVIDSSAKSQAEWMKKNVTQ